MIMMICRKIRTVINRPSSVGVRILHLLSPFLNDSNYLKLLFPLEAGYPLNLEAPETFNEKLQWLKINYRSDFLHRYVDKYEAKNVIREKVGEQYVVKNLGIWDSFEKINFDVLPEKFVLKATHDQGSTIVCDDKSKLDLNKLKRFFTKRLRQNHFYLSREWPYKIIQPRILAEELLEDLKIKDLWDFKFYCFHGVPKIMYISMGRQEKDVSLYYYDMDFNPLNISRPGFKEAEKILDKPKNWNLMIYLARKLSANLPHVRVDFYEVNGEVRVGELTFFQGGGMMPFYPKKWDYILGNWIDLKRVELER